MKIDDKLPTEFGGFNEYPQLFDLDSFASPFANMKQLPSRKRPGIATRFIGVLSAIGNTELIQAING
jgi:hypothetical protein